MRATLHRIAFVAIPLLHLAAANAAEEGAAAAPKAFAAPNTAASLPSSTEKLAASCVNRDNSASLLRISSSRPVFASSRRLIEISL